MGDRIAFYKWFRIGDFVQYKEGLRPEHQSVEPVHSPWSEIAVVGEVGPSVFWTLSLKLAYFRDEAGESARDLKGRMLTDLIAWKRAIGFGTSGAFVLRGPVIVVQDGAELGLSHGFLADDPVTGGSAVAIPVDRDATHIPTDSLLYIQGQGEDVYDLTTAVVVAGSVITAGSVQTYANPPKLYWPELVMLNAQATLSPGYDGGQEGGTDFEEDIEVAFRSVTDPIWLGSQLP